MSACLIVLCYLIVIVEIDALSMAAILLNAGADIDAEDGFSTASDMARKHRTSYPNSKFIYNDIFVLVLCFRHVCLVLQQREQEFSAKLSAYANFKGFTALHYAVLLRDTDIIDLLLKSGMCI